MNNNWEFDYSELYNTNPTPQYAAQVQPEPQKKKHGGVKRAVAIVALVAVCGGVSVGGGYVGTRLAQQNAPTVEMPTTVTGDTTTPIVAAGTGNLTVAQIAAIAGPSVVEVATESVTTNNFLGQYIQDGAGSGVIISSDGYIITNNHVVSGADQIRVTLADKNQYTATLVGTDVSTDVAVLKIDADGLTAATIGNSDNLTVGEFALAVGNPMGTLGGTVTDGIISALNRDITIGSQTMNLLQTNAAVSPGNSGGGLFNGRGELVGIVNAKSGGTNTEGLGFAIPINTAVKVANEIRQNGYVTGRPAMGVNVIAITDLQTAMQYGVTRTGVYIQNVVEGGAADKAGLKQGDLFIAIDGHAINETSDVTGLLSSYSVGDKIEVQVARDKKILTVKLTLEEKHPETTPVQDTQNKE